MERKYSIIIPVYNVEKYLDQCLESIINQTYTNIEIIIIDDGSTDASPSICDSYAKLDKRIKVIHKKNEGLGYARNTGLDVYTGDYVLFVDSDDFVSTKTIEIINEVLNEKEYDLVCFDYAIYNKKEMIFSKYKAIDKEFNGTNETFNYFLKTIYNKNNKLRYHNCSWNKAYSSKFIKKVDFKFVSERIYISEDYFTNMLFFNNLHSVRIIKDILYFYRNNFNSLTHVYRYDRVDKIMFEHNELIKLCAKYENPKLIKEKIFIQTLSNIIGAINLLFSFVEFDSKEKRKVFDKIIKRQDVKNIICQTSINCVSFEMKILLFVLKLKMYSIAYGLFVVKNNNC